MNFNPSHCLVFVFYSNLQSMACMVRVKFFYVLSYLFSDKKDYQDCQIWRDNRCCSKSVVWLVQHWLIPCRSTSNVDIWNTAWTALLPKTTFSILSEGTQQVSQDAAGSETGRDWGRELKTGAGSGKREFVWAGAGFRVLRAPDIAIVTDHFVNVMYTGLAFEHTTWHNTSFNIHS